MKQGLDEIRRTIREVEPQTPSMFLKTMADETRAAVAQRRQSDPHKLTKLLRGDLDWIVMKALEKDRGRRYETAKGLADDIERHLVSEPVLARPVSPFYRFRRLVRRNRLVFAAAGAVTAALMIGLSVALSSLVREQMARNDEGIQRNRAEDAVDLLTQALVQMEMRQASAKRMTQSLLQRSLDAQITGLGVLRGRADFTMDGLRVVTVSDDNTARILDVRTGEPLGNPLQHAGRITFVRFSPDARQVLTASEDKTAQLWNVADNQRVIPPLIHSAGVNHAEWSADGLRIATASEDQTARVWDAHTGGPITKPLQHGISVKSTQFSRDGQQIASVAADNSVLVWSIDSEQRESPLLKHDDEVDSIRFSSEGKYLLTLSAGGKLRLLEIATGREIVGNPRNELAPITEWDLKAALIAKFPEYFTWPTDVFPGSDSPWRVGILGGSLPGKSILRFLQTARIDGRRIDVAEVEVDADMRGLHMLFITSSEAYHAAALLGRLKGSNVLTIGEAEGFADLGVMIFFWRQGATVRFGINRDAINNSELEISPNLLKLASPVKGKAKGK